jgi:site-specific recombinase XerD
VNDIGSFCNALNINNLEQFGSLTSADINNFYKYAKDNNFKNTTINSRMRTIKQLYKWLNHKKYINNEIIFDYKPLRADTEHTYLPSNEDVDKLLTTIKKHTKKKRLFCMVSLYLASGLRREALCNIKLDHISNNNQIKTYNKGNKISIKDIPSEVMDLIYDYINTERKEIMEVYKNIGGNDLNYLFVSDIGQNPKSSKDLKNGNKINSNSFYQQLKNIARKANIENWQKFGVHSFRKFFLTSLWRKTRDIKIVQSAANHTSSQTTLDLYVDEGADNLKNAMLNQNPISDFFKPKENLVAKTAREIELENKLVEMQAELAKYTTIKI